MISKRLDKAYRQTRYRAELPTGAVDLLIDQPCPLLDVWLDSRKLGSAAFITACNPHSRPLEDADNMQRLRQLEAELQEAEADTRIELENRLTEVRTKRTEVERQLEDVQSASESSWEELQSGLENAWEELTQSVEDARQTFTERVT